MGRADHLWPFGKSFNAARTATTYELFRLTPDLLTKDVPPLGEKIFCQQVKGVDQDLLNS